MKFRDDYIALHNQEKFFHGFSLLTSKDQIFSLVKKTNSQSILDYGSGKGQQYSVHKMDLYWGVEVDCYDPGYIPFSNLPDKTYDGVVCTEVMEHVPEEEVDGVLEEIFQRAQKFVYFTISLELSNDRGGKTLLNGSNLHVTIKPRSWWNERVALHNKNNIEAVVLYTGNKRN